VGQKASIGKERSNKKKKKERRSGSLWREKANGGFTLLKKNSGETNERDEPGRRQKDQAKKNPISRRAKRVQSKETLFHGTN